MKNYATASVVVFGSGFMAHSLLPAIRENFNIISFADEEECIHNAHFMGYPLMPIHCAKDIKFDYIRL